MKTPATEADSEATDDRLMTKADLAEFGERMQREMRLHTLYRLGGIGTLLALFDLFG